MDCGDNRSHNRCCFDVERQIRYSNVYRNGYCLVFAYFWRLIVDKKDLMYIVVGYV